MMISAALARMAGLEPDYYAIARMNTPTGAISFLLLTNPKDNTDTHWLSVNDVMRLILNSDKTVYTGVNLRLDESGQYIWDQGSKVTVRLTTFGDGDGRTTAA